MKDDLMPSARIDPAALGWAAARSGDALRVDATVQGGETHRGELNLVGEVHDGQGRLLWTGPLRLAAQAGGAACRSLPLFDAEQRTTSFLEPLAALPAVRCAVVHPCDPASLEGALAAAREGLIEPVLVAPREKLLALAAQCGLALDGLAIEDVPHSHAAARRAVELAAQGRVAALMKGSLHTDELMHEVIACVALRSKRRMSHVFRIDAPLHDRPLLLTDAALNIRPTLDEKCDIVANAIELAHALGLPEPRVALLSAVETITEKLPSTLDAAALCKMAERGQIQGAVLDGPLAFDNAVSPEAAERKGIRSRVAGQADVLVVPDMESGNMLAKQMEYLGGAITAGIVMGAQVPIALTSRADGVLARRASAGLVKILAHWFVTHRP